MWFFTINEPRNGFLILVFSLLFYFTTLLNKISCDCKGAKRPWRCIRRIHSECFCLFVCLFVYIFESNGNQKVQMNSSVRRIIIETYKNRHTLISQMYGNHKNWTGICQFVNALIFTWHFLLHNLNVKIKPVIDCTECWTKFHTYEKL